MIPVVKTDCIILRALRVARERPFLRMFVTTQPQLIRNPDRGEQRCSLSPHCCILGGRAFGPPLCRGCAPATPPSKTIPHRPCAFLATCRLARPCACPLPSNQPKVGATLVPALRPPISMAPSNQRRLFTSCVTKSLHGSKDDWLVNCCGLVVTNVRCRSGRPAGASRSRRKEQPALLKQACPLCWHQDG